MNTRSHRVALQESNSYDRIVIAELIDLSMQHIGMPDSFYGKTVKILKRIAEENDPEGIRLNRELIRY